MRKGSLLASLLSPVLLLAFTELAAPPANAASSSSPTTAARPWDTVIVSPPWQKEASQVGPGCPCTGGTPENEPDCGLDKSGISNDTTNGGCNFTPFLATPIACGETICATTGNSAASNRDTDWFLLSLAQETTVELSLTTEFASPISGFINSSGGPPSCLDLGTDWTFTTSTCSEANDSRTLSAGEWWIFVAADFGPGVACGTPYTLTIECPLFSDGFEFGDVCNWSATSGAVSTCLACGNSVVELGEECDDGNLTDNDGCNSSCQIDSCSGYCGDLGPPSLTCYCDASCVAKGDCCYDACSECGSCPDPNSCVDSCGIQAPGGCFCDEECVDCGDCCEDACAVCGQCGPLLTAPRSDDSELSSLFVGPKCRRGAPD